MRSAYSFSGFSPIEIRVVLTPDHLARVAVDGVFLHGGVQVGHGKKGRDVGIVHKELAAKAVYLEGIDRAKDGMLYNGLFPEGLLHFSGEGQAFIGQILLAVHGGEDLGGFAEGRDGHEVGGDEEFEGGGVVGGTEGRCDEAAGAHGVSASYHALGVQLAVGDAKERVGAVAAVALLFAEDRKDAADGP